MKRLAFLIALAGACAAVSRAADFSIVDRFPIGGEARYDYLRVDPAMRRLYVAHGAQVDVLNADTGTKLGAIGGMHGIHGIAIDPKLRRGFVTSGGDRTVVMFGLDTLKTLKVITGVGVGPDAVKYDPVTERIYVANGQSGGITVIDPDTGDIAVNIPVDGKLEGMAFDGRGRLFVNSEDRSEIQVVDFAAMQVVAAWPLGPVEGGTGLAADAIHHRLFSAGGNGKLAVVDSDTGRMVAVVPIGEDPDGDAFDATDALIFTSNMPGTLSIIHEDTPDSYSPVQTVLTAYGARTIAFDPKSGNLFLPAAKFGPLPAPTAADPHPRRQGKPGSFEVLVVGR
ncbi:MAG TPA: hypothetical protein VGG34_04145 [Opitutaceae bacterium]|jgi:DNA-binding beta-propeller fold protein YncE